MSESLEKPRKFSWSHAAGWIALLGLIASYLGIWVQIRTSYLAYQQQAKLQSAQYVLALSDSLGGPKYSPIVQAIENNPGSYPLYPKGRFTQYQLEDYIGRLDTIATLVADGIIAEPMAYNEFSYDFEKAYCNKNVQADIAQARKDDGVATGTSAFFWNFEQLTNTFLQQDKKSCVDMDKE